MRLAKMSEAELIYEGIKGAVICICPEGSPDFRAEFERLLCRKLNRMLLSDAKFVQLYEGVMSYV